MTDLGSEQTGSKYAISEASSGFFVVQAFSWKALNVLLSRYSFQEDSLSLMTTFPSEDSRFKEAKFIHFLVGAFPRTTLDSIFLLTISGSSLSVLNSPPPPRRVRWNKGRRSLWIGKKHIRKDIRGPQLWCAHALHARSPAEIKEWFAYAEGWWINIDLYMLREQHSKRSGDLFGVSAVIVAFRRPHVLLSEVHQKCCPRFFVCKCGYTVEFAFVVFSLLAW